MDDKALDKNVAASRSRLIPVIGTIGENEKPMAASAEAVSSPKSNDAMRESFEKWYAENAFDYVANPIGSRECGLQWKAWQAALAAPVDTDAQPSTASAVKSAADIIFKAAIDCPHTIDSNSVTLHFDAKKPGQNALNQLHARILAEIYPAPKNVSWVNEPPKMPWDAPVQSEAKPVADWSTGTPPTKEGKFDEYIVAVQRKASEDRVFVFAAFYANSYSDHGSLCDRDGEAFIAHGWHSVDEDSNGEFDSIFTPLLQDGDVVLGWQPLPAWGNSPNAAPAQSEEEPVHQIFVADAGWRDISKGYYNALLEDTRQRSCRILYTAPSAAPAGDGGDAAQPDFALTSWEPNCLRRSLDEVEALSFTEDRDITVSEAESMMCVVDALRQLLAARHAPTGANTLTELHRVQWWLSKVDSFGTAWAFDGPHSDRASADEAAYLMPALGLQKEGERYAVVEARITDPQPSDKGFDHAAIAQNRPAKRGSVS